MSRSVGQIAGERLVRLRSRAVREARRLKTAAGHRRARSRARATRNPQVVFDTALPRPTIATIQRGILNYTYKGIKTWKSPFDLALYHLVLSKVRPRSIIEFGSKYGGSALWFADVMATHGIDGHVFSFDRDLKGVGVSDDRITFAYCDVAEPERYLTDEFMHGLARPILVIDDSSHRYQHVLNILEFADRWLDEDDYIIIEDGIVDHMRTGPNYEGGTPLKAISEFLTKHPTAYRVDRELCDFFGTNTTWAVDGYLQPLRDRRSTRR